MSKKDAFINNIKQQLDSIEVDDTISRQLNRGRHKAIHSSKTSPPFWANFWGWKPAVAYASVGLLSLTIWMNSVTDEDKNGFNAIDDLELLSAQDSLELYENLDFYLWLEEQDMDDIDQA